MANKLTAKTKNFANNKSHANNKTISYRRYGSEETITLSQEEFINYVKEQIELKK